MVLEPILHGYLRNAHSYTHSVQPWPRPSMLSSACLMRKSLQLRAAGGRVCPADGSVSDTEVILRVQWAEGAGFRWLAAASRLPSSSGSGTPNSSSVPPRKEPEEPFLGTSYPQTVGLALPFPIGLCQPCWQNPQPCQAGSHTN